MDKKYILDLNYDKLVSICIKSRNRPEQLAKCIQSFIDTVDDISRIEILIRIDNDDYNTWSKMDLIPDMVGDRPVPLKILKGPRFGGYVDIWKHDNHLAETALGEFMFYFNDDAIIDSKGWDTVIADYQKHVCILKSDFTMHDNHGNTLTGDQFPHQENIFPIIHSAIIHANGFFGFHEATDKQWDMVCETDPNLLVKENRIKSTHFQGTGEHVLDGLPPTDPNGIYSPENVKRVKAMVPAVHKYIKSQGGSLDG